MRRTRITGTDLESSVLGMGCAPLGSRYSSRQSLRALDRAFDAGVSWYDVAPSYGAGEAEAILGRFLKGRREVVQVVTKVGLRASRMGLLKQIALPVARPLVATLKGLRKTGRVSGAVVNDKVALSPDFIVQTLHASLRALATDRVEVLLLHEPTPQEVTRDDVLQTMESLLRAGKVRHVGVAGSHAVGVAAASTGVYQVVQMEDNPERTALTNVQSGAVAPIGVISHSVFGGIESQNEAHRRLLQDPELAAQVGGADQIHRLLLWRALSVNTKGVVLASLAQPGNLEDNLAAAALDPVLPGWSNER